ARITPREALRRFHAPEELHSTRRQWLGSLAASAAAVGCSTNEGTQMGAGTVPQSPGTVNPVGGAPTGSAVELTPPAPIKRGAYDLVELGSTGIVVSRVAMGSGTNGFNGSSVQTRMGADFTRLLLEGYDRGIRFFETADAYGAHRLVGDAM